MGEATWCLGMRYHFRVPNYLCSWRSMDLKYLPYLSSAASSRKKGKCPHTVYCLAIRLIPCLWRQVAWNYSRLAASQSYLCSSLALSLHQGGRANVCTFFFPLIQSTACAQRQPDFCHYTEDIQAHLKTKPSPILHGTELFAGTWRSHRYNPAAVCWYFSFQRALLPSILDHYYCEIPC